MESSSETATHAVKALDAAVNTVARSDVAVKADPPPTKGSVDGDGGGSLGIINWFNMQPALLAAAAALVLASIALATTVAHRRN